MAAAPAMPVSATTQTRRHVAPAVIGQISLTVARERGGGSRRRADGADLRLAMKVPKVRSGSLPVTRLRWVRIRSGIREVNQPVAVPVDQENLPG